MDIHDHFIETLNEDAAAERNFNAGYNAALGDCIGLLRKWFWGKNKDARACEADMRKLKKS